MSESTIGGNDATTQATIPVEAALEWKGSRAVPKVTLSFDGLHAPGPLLAELGAIGWSVPAIPPRPSSAIEWVPDPVAGTDYTIHSWQVEGFTLGRGAWATDVEEHVTQQTLATLGRYGVPIDGDTRQIESTPTDVAAPAVAPAAPAGAPQVILIGYTGAPNPHFRPGTASSGGRKRETETWTETTDLAIEVCPSSEARSALASDSVLAWEVQYGQEPSVPTGSDQLAVCAAIPDTPADDKKLRKLVSMLGGTIQIASLVPLDLSGSAQGALVYGSLPTAHAELATSTLRLRCPSAIVRDEV